MTAEEMASPIMYTALMGNHSQSESGDTRSLVHRLVIPMTEKQLAASCSDPPFCTTYGRQGQ